MRGLPIGDVEANSSVIVVVTVERTDVGRAKRAYFISEAAAFSASYICDILRRIGAQLPVFTRKTYTTPYIPFWYRGGDGAGDPGGYDGGSGSEVFLPPIQIKMPSCESCIDSILKCLVDLFPIVGVLDECCKSIVL